MKINFNSQGTDKLLIGRQAKMGLGSLDTLPLRQYYVLEENQTAVVLIRDVIDKWRSGYKQELQEMLYNSPYLINFIEQPENLPSNAICQFGERLSKDQGYYETFTNPDDVTKVGLEIMRRVHDYYADLSWMTFGHAEFWSWNNMVTDRDSLLKLSMKPNIYFLELKDLSNLKFLEWLQERDEGWKEIEKIPHQNVTPSHFWSQLELLWKEYNEGKIMKGEILVSPFFKTGETILQLNLYFELCRVHQDEVDYIRNSHDRYLKFED
jgi:hypothetical protein